MRNKKELFAAAILLGAGGTVAGLAEEINAEEVAVSEITQEDSTITDTRITIEEPETKEEDHPENPAEPAELPDSPTLPDQTALQQTPAEKEEEPQPEEEQVQEPAVFAMQTRAVSQNITLNGYVVQSGQTIDLSKIQADVIILQASSGYAGVNQNFDTLAQQIVNSGKQLAMYHEARTGTKEDAHMEAYHFYQTIRNFVNKGFPVLHFVNDIEAGPVWADEFIDSLYGLSGKKGIIWTDTNNLEQGDWEEAKKEYTVTTNVQKLERGACEKANTYTLPTENNEMYRMYNPNSGEHFYTKAAQERDNLVKAGWRYESIGWTAPGKGEVVYRLYNPNAGDHHYTLNGAERDMLIQKGWRYEGTGWQAGGKTAVYRLYNPNARSGAHHFTTSKEEYEWLARLGWRKEGVAWYGANSSVPANKFPGSSYLKGDYGYSKNKTKLSGIQKIGDNFYYFDPSSHGSMKKGNGLFQVGDKTIFLNSNGKLGIGQIKVNEKWKWFDYNTAYMAISQIFVIPAQYNGGKEKLVYYDASGNMLVNGSTMLGNFRITTAGDGEVIKSELLNLDSKYLLQTDPKWRNIRVGYYTISSSGCVVTSAATIINYFTGTNYSPVDIGNKAYQKGYFNVGGAGSTSEIWRYITDSYGLTLQNHLNYEGVKRALLEGKIVTGAVGYNCLWCPWYGVTHEIYMAGYDNGKIKVYDPNNAKNTGIFNLSDVLSHPSKHPNDNQDGGPFYAIGKK